jgi:hypothetical protein
MARELYPEAIDIINKKFNVLLYMDCRDFDTNLEILSDRLDKIKKESYQPNDRILLVHMDTDYYDRLLPCGLVTLNLIRMFKNKDIPLYLLLFVTNHYGIRQEFDVLLKDQHPKDWPTIIETVLSVHILSSKLDMAPDLAVDKIEKSGICMMGQQRSHRVALCNFLKNNQLLSKVALKTNFK